MKKTINFTCLLLLMFLSPISSASDEDTIWDDDGEGDFYKDNQNAKLQRHMAKSRALEANMTEEEREQNRSGNPNSCGGVNVGNVAAPENGNVENVVIVRGDIINANNRCR